MVSTRLYM